MSEGEKVVCVTGASGYIASWVVQLLLQRGYLVKAKTQMKRRKALQLFKADLLEEGSFNSAVEGSECVFHTASPVNLFPQDPQAGLVDPAVKCTCSSL